VRIHDFPLFQIWPDGRVWSTKWKKFVAVSYSHGYAAVSLSRGSRDTYECCPTSVHRLLGLYFIPNPDDKPLVDHRDRDKGNNTLTNLRWVTELENSQNKSLLKANKTGTTGVRLLTDAKRSRPWYAHISVNKKKEGCYFATKEEAIAWRKAMELEHYIQD
jgi:hypothetical protein